MKLKEENDTHLLKQTECNEFERLFTKFRQKSVHLNDPVQFSKWNILGILSHEMLKIACSKLQTFSSSKDLDHS